MSNSIETPNISCLKTEYLEYKTKVDSLINEFVLNNSNSENEKNFKLYGLNGGKRIRPIISLIIADSLKLKINDDMLLFLELLHNASLILDDMPCMDNDNYRRGMLSFHAKFGVTNGYIFANYLIGTACSGLVKQVTKLTTTSISVYNLIYNVIFNNNILTSIGQIIDLDLENSGSKACKFLDSIYNKLIQNKLVIKFSNDIKEKIKLTNDTFKQIIYLNMKTYPLFFLSFVLPLLLGIDQETKSSICISRELLNHIELIAIVFSFMFQISDDFEDFEEDSKCKQINSHLKILSKDDAKIFYQVSKEYFTNYLSIILDKENDILPNTILFFVEILDKKISY